MVVSGKDLSQMAAMILLLDMEGEIRKTGKNHLYISHVTLVLTKIN